LSDVEEFVDKQQAATSSTFLANNHLAGVLLSQSNYKMAKTVKLFSRFCITLCEEMLL